MAVTLTIITETDPDDSSQYLDIIAEIDGSVKRIEYSRPVHFSTVVSTGGAAVGQADVPLDSVVDLEPDRRIKIDGIEHKILSVNTITPKVTLAANLVSALVGGEAVITDSSTLQSEIESDLTARGYTI